MSGEPRNVHRGIDPTLLVVIICLVGWMAGVLWPRILASLGVIAYGMTYLDSYAILAALDAVRAGQDPYAVNPLDPLGRWHVYSDWWLGLRWLGLGREHNFLVGTTWFGGFALACWLAVRPRDRREAGWMAVVLLSPPVLLAFLRANNDLVIFVLLALTGLAITGTGWVRQLLGVAAVVLATGLKYYPATAVAGFLWTRPIRRVPVVLLVAAAGVTVTLLTVWPQMERARFLIASGVHTMGAPLLGRDFGWSDPASQRIAIVVIALGALGFALGRFTTGLASRGTLRERALAVLGAVPLLACFVSGVNYAYRWIFVFWIALWIWRQATSTTGSARERWTARTAAVLVVLCLWLDGLLCFVCNRLVQLPPAQFAALDPTWRLFTQPLQWLLMTLLAGWLLEGALALFKEWRAAPTGHEAGADAEYP
jgi:hypothetical protein